MAEIRDLLKRLTQQLAAKGENDAHEMAKGILIARGDMHPDGTLTAHGRARQALGAEGRAKDRAVRRAGGTHSPSEYTYDPRTNRATLKEK